MTVSPIEEMNKAIACIKDDNKDIDDKIQALETLSEWCDHIDIAMGMLIFHIVSRSVYLK